jgi:nucleotide-binding universal stress UspA family protein
VESCEVTCAKPHTAIRQRAREVSADLIVIGPHRSRAVADRVLGSTVDRVIRTSEVPCLIVRELQAQVDAALASSGVGSLLKIRIDLREGEPAAGEILRITDAEQIDLLVLGTHGRSSLGRALIGSVSSTVTRQAEVPVLLVPPVR